MNRMAIILRAALPGVRASHVKHGTRTVDDTLKWMRAPARLNSAGRISGLVKTRLQYQDRELDLERR